MNRVSTPTLNQAQRFARQPVEEMSRDDIMFQGQTLLDNAKKAVQEEAQLRIATSELLDAVTEFIARYVVLGDESDSPQATVLALWCLHTWAIDAADCTPYIVLESATPRCGKTRTLEVLRLLVKQPWLANSVTEAALFRKMEAEHPTLLLDETDAIFGAGPREPLRAVLNAGNRRGSSVTRAEGKSYREFPTFGPKVLAGIATGALPDTIRDRSIIITLQRRDDQPVQRFRVRQAEMEAVPLAFSLDAWAAATTPPLANATPDIPDSLSDRAGDAWEPLLALAEFAGNEWSQHAYEAAEKLSSEPPAAPEPLDPATLREHIKQARRSQCPTSAT